MEHLDVVIVGAGLSGIGAACHLETHCPSKSYALLESRGALGGTWDLFRYPGIRSDSDMHTLGYRFRPWRAKEAIADGPAIREYVTETAREYDVEKHIRFHHALTRATWSSADNRWELEIECGTDDAAETKRLSCAFLMMCSGYYNYKQGHAPKFEGSDQFDGPIVHPQFWPEDLDYRGKRVAIIGSGATAVTLVPSIAEQAAHVMMVQRSPTYVVSRPRQDAVANFLRKILPDALAYRLTRWKNVRMQHFFYGRTRTHPEWIKKKILDAVEKELGPDYDIEKHFTPTYDPWDQRLCLIPDSDLFRAIKDGRASVVTDQIDRFTESGIQLASGEKIEADVIVTATGLEMQVLGGARFAIDDEPIDFAKTWTYKGMLYSGVPNLIQTFGYINASWTLRADLNSEFACRLINHMDECGAKCVVAKLRESDRGMPARPWIDDFSSSYMQRSMHLFPKQGDRDPWLNTQNYVSDKKMIRDAPLEDGVLQFVD